MKHQRLKDVMNSFKPRRLEEVQCSKCQWNTKDSKMSWTPLNQENLKKQEKSIGSELFVENVRHKTLIPPWLPCLPRCHSPFHLRRCRWDIPLLLLWSHSSSDLWWYFLPPSLPLFLSWSRSLLIYDDVSFPLLCLSPSSTETL